MLSKKSSTASKVVYILKTSSPSSICLCVFTTSNGVVINAANCETTNFILQIALTLKNEVFKRPSFYISCWTFANENQVSKGILAKKTS